MMAMRKSGIQLIVGNFAQFMSSLGKVNKAYDKMGKSADQASTRIRSLGTRVANASGLQANAMRQVEKANIRLDRARTKAVSTDKVRSKQLSALATKFSQLSTTQKLVGGQTEALNIVNEEMAVKLQEIYDGSDDVQLAMLSLADAEEHVEMTTRNTALAQALLGEEMAAAGAAAGISSVALAALGIAVVALGAAVAVAVIGFRAFKKAVSLAVSAAKTLWDWAKRLANVIGGTLKSALSSIAKTGIGDMINSVTSAMRGLVSELGTALSFFQRLDIQLETLTARDYAKEFGVPMSVAFKETSGAAQALLDWIRRIAVTTPFSVQNLSRTVAMANAMGLNIDMAKELTLATGDFVAAMGLEEEHMFRIIYNFGQMLSQGKLNGREFRDLANSFVPVWQIMEKMGEQAGMTAQEMKKLAFEGGVPVQAFFKEFINIASTDYPDAMKKMARTAQGVANNIKDFLQTVVGMEILGPTFDRATARAANALDKLLNPAVQRSAHLLGESLDLAVNQVVLSLNRVTGAIGNFFRALGFAAPSAEQFAQTILNIGVILRRFGDHIYNFINRMSEQFAGGLEGIARNAGMWGYNIIGSLAAGMAKGASLVVTVLTTIGRILSTWLVGRSPPKIAPYIDQWGADMITEWTQGWLKADFSAFKDLAGIVETYLRSISFTMKETALVPRILGSRKVISDLINKVRDGFLTVAQAADKLISRVKGITAEFANYAKAMFAVVDATKALEVAEQAVAAAEKIVAAQAEKVAEAMELVDAQAKKVADALKLVTNQAKLVAAAEKIVAEQAKLVAEAMKLVTEQAKKIATAEKIVKAITKELAIVQDELADATARVREEQEYLSDVMDGYSSILDDLNKQLRGVTTEYDEQQRLLKINQALSSGLLTAAEKERLEMEKRALELKAQIRGVEDQRDAEKALIEERIDGLEAEKDAVQIRIDAIEARKAAAQAEVDALGEIKDAYQEQVDALKEVQDAYQEQVVALKEVQDEYQEQVDVLKEVQDEYQEQVDVLKEVQETYQEQVDVLQKVADARQADVEVMQEQLDISKMLIEEQTKQNDLIGEQIALLEKLADTGSSALGDLVAAFEDFELALGGLEEDPNAAVRAMADRILAQIKLAEMFEAAELNADTFFNETLPKILSQFETNFMANFTGDMQALEDAWAPLIDIFGAGGSGSEVKEMANRMLGWDVAVKKPSPAQEFATAMQDIAAAMGPVDWAAVADAIVAIAEALAAVDWARVAEGVKTTKDAFKELGPDILDASLTGNPAAIGLAVGKFLDAVGSEMYEGVGEKPKWWEMAGAAIVDWILNGTTQEIDTTMVPALERSFKTDWKLVAEDTRTSVMNDIIVPWMSEMFTTISTETEATVTDWGTKWEQAKTDFATQAGEIKDTLLPDLTGTIWEMMSTTMFDTELDWNEKWTLMTGYLAIEVTNALNTFKDTPLAQLATSLIDDLGGGIRDLIDDYWTPLKDYLAEEVTTALDTFRETPLAKLVLSIADDFGGGIKDLIDDYLDPLKTNISDALTTAFDNFRTGPLASIKTAFDKLKEAIEKVKSWIDKVKEAISSFNLGKLAKLLAMFTGGARAGGGPVIRGEKYIVGERGPETFIPLETGLIMPNWWTEKVFAQPSHSTANSQTTYIEVNPTYANVQSEASIYYDVTAALAAARL